MKERTWLITGVSSGIGKALAANALAAGDIVYGTFRKSAQSESFSSDSPGKSFGLVADLSDPLQVEALLNRLETDKIDPDVLVNNAGMGFAGAIEETTLEEMRRVFEVNFFATHALTCAVLPGMRNRNSGCIIQLSSHSGVASFPGFGTYSASKFALEGLTEALKAEVEPFGIKVLLIEPGPFRTHFARGLPEAENRLKAYEETSGAFRDKLKAVSGKQEGNPAKAAELIYHSVISGNHPFRLVLGPTALRTIAMKRDALDEALKASEPYASQVIY